MVGIYFSGTGNSKYAIERFCKEYDEKTVTYSIEDNDALSAIINAELLVFAYPVQFSTVPKILRNFIMDNRDLQKGKK